MTVFAWERTVQGGIARMSQPVLPTVRVLNIILAGEEVMTTAAPWLVAGVLLTSGWPVALLIAVALLTARHVEAWAKTLAHRGRPRDETETGLPSGDCAIVTIWALPLLGWWGFLPIAFVVWARMALGAHWPLDVLAGAGTGVVLVAPALLIRGSL